MRIISYNYKSYSENTNIYNMLLRWMGFHETGILLGFEFISSSTCVRSKMGCSGTDWASMLSLYAETSCKWKDMDSSYRNASSDSKIC